VHHTRWWQEPFFYIPACVIVLFVAFVMVIRIASSSASTPAKPIDGIACTLYPNQQTSVAHLSIYNQGSLQTIPQGIGFVKPWSTNLGTEGSYSGSIVIGGACVYPLTTDAPTGLIHILGKSSAHDTLGLFFDIWHKPLTATSVLSWNGTEHVYVNGHVFNGNPRDIRLNNHTVIQIDIGSKLPAPHSYVFP
jgi:hypothetical protein